MKFLALLALALVPMAWAQGCLIQASDLASINLSAAAPVCCKYISRRQIKVARLNTFCPCLLINNLFWSAVLKHGEPNSTCELMNMFLALKRVWSPCVFVFSAAFTRNPSAQQCSACGCELFKAFWGTDSSSNLLFRRFDVSCDTLPDESSVTNAITPCANTVLPVFQRAG